MDNVSNMFGGDIFAVLIFLIVAGMFTGSFGIGGGNNQITNDFLYTNLANQVRDNANGIATVDRDVLTSSCNTDKEILESKLTTQMGFQAQQAQLSSCCCELKSLIRDEVQGIKDLINNNTIQDLRDTKQGYELVAALGNSVNTITNRFGTFYPNPPYSPYYYNGYYGTTIQ